MDIRTLTPAYAVSPQIAPEDLPAIKAAGFTRVICNRPDMENPVELGADVLKVATEAAGLSFVENPVMPGQMTMENVEVQAAACAEADGPVLAYCASGNRSSIVWSFAQAGQMPTEDIIAACARGGYDQAHIAPQIDALAEARAQG
ncbi:MAG: TIGR01244 family sulfur transferase [Pseudomonadota bacterium]